MAWRKIEDDKGNFIRVYEATPRIHMTVSFFSENELPPKAVHTDIMDPPDAMYVYDAVLDQWVENLESLKEVKKQELEVQAREKLFNASPEKIEMDAAFSEVDSAMTKVAIESVKLGG